MPGRLVPERADQALVLGLCRSVAGAREVVEHRTSPNGDVRTLGVNSSVTLNCLQRERHAGSRCAQHQSQEVVGERKLVALQPVVSNYCQFFYEYTQQSPCFVRRRVTAACTARMARSRARPSRKFGIAATAQAVAPDEPWPDWFPRAKANHVTSGACSSSCPCRRSSTCPSSCTCPSFRSSLRPSPERRPSPRARQSRSEVSSRCSPSVKMQRRISAGASYAAQVGHKA